MVDSVDGSYTHTKTLIHIQMHITDDASRNASVYYDTPLPEIYFSELNITESGVSIFRCFTMGYGCARPGG